MKRGTALRVEGKLLKAIDAYGEKVTRQTGVRVSRAGVAEALLRRGLARDRCKGCATLIIERNDWKEAARLNALTIGIVARHGAEDIARAVHETFKAMEHEIESRRGLPGGMVKAYHLVKAIITGK